MTLPTVANADGRATGRGDRCDGCDGLNHCDGADAHCRRRGRTWDACGPVGRTPMRAFRHSRLAGVRRRAAFYMCARGVVIETRSVGHSFDDPASGRFSITPLPASQPTGGASAGFAALA